MTVRCCLFLCLFVLSGINAQAQFLSTIDTLILEETDEVFLGDVDFGDMSNDIIPVIDKSQSKVILFSRSGKLVSYFGRKGAGPGDLTSPTSATILSDGSILVTEFSGRITIFSQTGDVISITSTGINHLSDSMLLPNGTVLLIGAMYSPEDLNLFHFFDVKSMTIEKEFFPLPLVPEEYAMQPLTLAKPAFATVCSDRIVAFHPMLPELFFFDFDGTKTNHIKLRSTLFTVMEKTKTITNPEKSLGNTSWGKAIYCVNSDQVLLQFVKDLTGKNGDPTSFLLVNIDGEVIYESSGVPNILFSEPGTDTLYYYDRELNSTNTLVKSLINRN